MQTTLRLAPASRVPVLLLIVGVLVLAIAAAAVFVGSRAGPAPIVGIAHNGPIIYSEDGDLYRFDPSTGESVAVLTGPENDIGPRFSRDGLSFAFVRTMSMAAYAVVVANADGSNAREVTNPLPDVRSVDWSPDGSRLVLVTGSNPGSIMIANADGSRYRRLLAGGVDDIDGVLWVGPSGDELLFRGVEAGVAGLYIIPADGSEGPRLITADLPSTANTFRHPAITLDGSSVTWSSFEQSEWQPAVGERTAGWDGMLEQVHVLDLATGKDVLIPPPTDPLVESQPVDSYAPVFSPDGSQLVFLRDRSDGRMELGVAPVDGSDPGRSLGPLKPWSRAWPSFGFTPDATHVIVAYADENVAHLLSLDGGEGTTVPRDVTGIPSMQRIAP